MSNVDKGIVEHIRRRLDRPVVLIGLMGVGKTKMGRHLAKALGVSFVDSDEEIERAAGMSVSDIFDRFGEDYFRSGECRVLKRLLEDKETEIIATGGGAVMNEQTAKLVWEKSVSVWLRAEMPVMIERSTRTKKRPLLQDNDPEEVFAKLMTERYPVYEKADIVIDSHNGPYEAILNQMLESLDQFLQHQSSATT